ncbi:MAG: hypothetical protein ABSD31_04905 [Candidatus Binataceae bacterium]|jgi:hypothetical protein
MRKMLIACAVTILVCAGAARGGETCSYEGSDEVLGTKTAIANRPWNSDNIAALRSLDQATIKKFYEDFWEEQGGGVEEEWGGSSWVDLAGDGKFELLVSRYNKAITDLTIFWQEAPGKLRVDYYIGAGSRS